MSRVSPARPSGRGTASNPVSGPLQDTPLHRVTDWVFDLDNTLYPRECDLFAQIDRRITDYVMALTRLDRPAARALQKLYYRDFGTTLNGLMRNHAVDPEHFLAKAHMIDYSPVLPHPRLIAAIRRLPGRKFILTNGDSAHAGAVLDRLGGGGALFADIYDIRAMRFVPKPHRQAYEGFFSRHGIDPTRAIMFDDLEKNLRVPHECGMITVQVTADRETKAAAAHIDHVTADLAGFLTDFLADFLADFPAPSRRQMD